MPKKPLEGVKVADFCWRVVGPLATKMLADYGAEVLKIEGKGRPDGERLTGDSFKDGIRGLDRSFRFGRYNTSKLSVALNLAHPRGIEVARRLVAWADVVTQSWSGGVGRKMGLGYEELRKVKPDIIMVTSCVMGEKGPYAPLTSLGPHLSATAGLQNIMGWPDREPADPEVYTDFIGPHFIRLVILAALDYRRRTGKGQYVDLSQYEGAIHFIAPLVLDNLVNQRVATRMGNRCDYAAPHNAYRCCGEDRWCAIAVMTDEEWKNFCRVIGNPAWTRGSGFATFLARKKNEEELDRLVEEWTINYSAEEVMSMMQAAGVAAGVLETTEDLLEYDPQLKHRHFHWELDHPQMEKYRSPRSSFVLSKSPCEVKRAPLLGEHNEYALKEILGLSDDEIAELVIEGVIE